MRNRNPVERFWEKVDRTGECWVWTAYRDAKGYGHFNPYGKTVRAHRFSYALVHGSIADDVQIDHICRNTSCVNPHHLRVVTTKQNCEHRGYTSGAKPYRDGRWQAHVCHHGRDIYLGLYDSKRDAELVALGGRLALFTHNDQDRT